MSLAQDIQALLAMPADNDRPRLGTVVSRDRGANDGSGNYPEFHTAVVVLDGDGGAVEVLCFANVRARPGDRVGMLKFGGSSWAIIGSFGQVGKGLSDIWPTYGYGFTLRAATNSLSTTGASVQIPGSSTMNFYKEQDWTRIEIRIDQSSWISGTSLSATVVIGAEFVNQDDPTLIYTYDVVQYVYEASATAARRAYGATVFTATQNPPAGRYTVYPVWRRSAGTGTINVSSADDYYSLLVTEKSMYYTDSDV